MILAENLIKSYRRRKILDGLSFRIKKNELTLFVGSNAAGKTTTLKILAGVLKPDSGSVKIDGIDIIQNRREAQKLLSFLPQAVTFDPRLSCRQLLNFYARLRKAPLHRVDKLLEYVGLKEEADKRSHELSGGLRQRLGLAVLLIPDAPVLLLDEPGLSLDPKWRVRLQEILRDEVKNGKTVFVTTHLLGEWEGVADSCLLCRDGKLKGELDPKRIREQFEL
ncbi:MAG: ABC transporter ATP-binding protein [Chthoniobacterales bacterium]